MFKYNYCSKNYYSDEIYKSIIYAIYKCINKFLVSKNICSFKKFLSFECPSTKFFINWFVIIKKRV